MDPRTMWLVIAVVAIAVVAAIGWYWARAQRTKRLRHRFGNEYDRTVHEKGDLRRAEAALEARAQRVEGVHIPPLNEEDQRRHSNPGRGGPRGSGGRSRRDSSTIRRARSPKPIAWSAKS